MEKQAMNINSETIVSETTASTIYVSFGFICVPLLFICLAFDKRMGRTIKEVFAASCNEVFHNPLILGIMIVLELLMATAYLRMNQQKLQLTPTTLITYTGYIKNKRTDIPLQDITSIKLLGPSDRLQRKLNCGTIIVETVNGEKLEFPIIKNPHGFVGDVEYQIFKLKQKDAKLNS